MTPEKEEPTGKKNKIGIPEDRQGRIRSWSEMNQLLDPFGLDEQNLKFARSYFHAQALIAEGKKVKAGRLFRALDKITGYKDFEDKNGFVLTAIDIAVRGKSSQRQD